MFPFVCDSVLDAPNKARRGEARHRHGRQHTRPHQQHLRAPLCEAGAGQTTGTEQF